MPLMSPEEVLSFRKQVEEDARPRRSYYGLIILSSTIATFGLLANSVAVVIGAMLVAPLMNSIIGVALGVILNSRHLLRQSALALVSGAALALATGAVLTWVSPMTEPGSEILSRIRPTLFDLWVATAAGLAGAYSLLRARGTAALPGVAIATALVPPLVTSGIELRLGDSTAALGAFLLFLSNMVAITCGGLAVFGFYGLARHAQTESGYRPLRAYGWWSGSFAVVGLILAQSLSQVVTEIKTRRTVQDTLTTQLGMIPGASMDRFDLSYKQGAVRIRAIVATPQSIGPPIVASAERMLVKRLRRPVELVVRSVLTKDANASAYLLTERPQVSREPALTIVERSLTEQTLAFPDAELRDYSVRRTGSGYRVSAWYHTQYPIDPLLVRGIRNILAEALGSPVELDLRSGPTEAKRQPDPAKPGLKGGSGGKPLGTAASDTSR
ncbi:MAG: TIGR00341 family protein [Actinomycetota bacterium]